MTTSDEYFEAAFTGQNFMAILRGLSAEQTVLRCHTAWDAGISLVEVPVHVPSAVPALVAAIAAGRDRGFQVGAGTVTTAELVREVHSAGAAFTVAPGTSEAVIRESNTLALPHMPGVATSSDITVALGLGLSWLKAFPAAQLGSAWIKAQHGPFPQVSFVATGGMDASNAAEFLAAGCRVVAVGSALDDPAQIARLAALQA